MGGAWSRQVEQTLSTLGKRKHPAGGHTVASNGEAVNERDPVSQKRHRSDTPGDSNARGLAGSVWDTTPDGEEHRYSVKCSGLYWDSRKDVQKVLNKLHRFPPYTGLVKSSRWDHFFICFPNQCCANIAVKTLSSQSTRGEQWCVSLSPQPKRRNFESATAQTRAVQPGICPSAADVTAKWRKTPYHEQVAQKRDMLEGALGLVTRHMRNDIKEKQHIPWLREIIAAHGKMKGNPPCCPLSSFISANRPEEIDHYRNKNEFTVGLSPDSCGIVGHQHESKLVIGYMLGQTRKGEFSIGAVDRSCATTSLLAVRVADVLTPVMRALNMPVYDNTTHTGYWRNVLVRESLRHQQFLVAVSVNPYEANLSEADQNHLSQKDKECRGAILSALREAFEPEFGTSFGVFWQPSGNMSALSSEIPVIRLYGLDSLQESMNGLMFRVQPTAFFQVNTLMAERLYNIIGELAAVTSDTIVFDLCCGTGTIGLTLAQRAHRVVGIEMNESAVEDAMYNAKLNAIDNAEFIAGKVEKVIQKVKHGIDSDRDCVVILDPPRAGVSNNVIAAIRSMKSVKRVVYVSCEAKNLWKNAGALCRPTSKTYQNAPFRPVKAVGIDLFPHTAHVELVTLWDRVSLS